MVKKKNVFFYHRDHSPATEGTINSFFIRITNLLLLRNEDINNSCLSAFLTENSNKNTAATISYQEIIEKVWKHLVQPNLLYQIDQVAQLEVA